MPDELSKFQTTGPNSAQRPALGELPAVLSPTGADRGTNFCTPCMFMEPGMRRDGVLPEGQFLISDAARADSFGTLPGEDFQ